MQSLTEIPREFGTSSLTASASAADSDVVMGGGDVKRSAEFNFALEVNKRIKNGRFILDLESIDEGVDNENSRIGKYLIDQLLCGNPLLVDVFSNNKEMSELCLTMPLTVDLVATIKTILNKNKYITALFTCHHFVAPDSSQSVSGDKFVIDSKFVVAIAKMLEENNTLEDYHLSQTVDNEDCDALKSGYVGFAAVLWSNRTLKSLSFGKSRMNDDEGAIVLGALRQGNTTLTYLGLHDNLFLESKTMDMLCQVVRENKTLKEIAVSFWGPVMKTENAQALASAVQTNTTLCAFDLDFQDFDDDARQLYDAISKKVLLNKKQATLMRLIAEANDRIESRIAATDFAPEPTPTQAVSHSRDLLFAFATPLNNEDDEDDEIRRITAKPSVLDRKTQVDNASSPTVKTVKKAKTFSHSGCMATKTEPVEHSTQSSSSANGLNASASGASSQNIKGGSSSPKSPSKKRKT